MTTNDTDAMHGAPSSQSLEHARALLGGTGGNEDAVKIELVGLLRALGYEVRTEADDGEGSADIFLEAHNVIIETKRRGQVDPDARRDDETQFEQLLRYVRSRSEQQRIAPSLDPRPRDWKGILTDGRLYYLYRWMVDDNGELTDPKPELRPFAPTAADDLCSWLTRRIGDVSAKRALPEDPGAIADIFRLRAPALRDLYGQLATQSGTVTKRKLWLEMNRGSGFTLDDSESDLFVDHTLLAHAADAVIASLEGNGEPGSEIVVDGFSSWPQNRGTNNEPRSQAGVDWTNELFSSVYEYDWRSRGRDVLRDVYQAVIRPEHRKAFGEFYTPDWLAEVIVNEVLDDAWCERSVTAALESGSEPLRGIGVLDPACGSGTFLYHAAKRVLECDAMTVQHLNQHDQAQIVVKLVNGIDIHPIAVSIARATLMRALPDGSGINPESLNVFQGDGLAIRGLNGMIMTNGNPDAPYVEIESPKGTMIPVPSAFAESPDFSSQLGRIVRSAHQGDALPAGITGSLSESDGETVRRMHAALTTVCAEEGDSVWTWYLSNQMATRSLARRGVDRIVANPPWVRMSNIQVEERKRQLEELIECLGLSSRGETATGFDIAGLFVRRCRDLFLNGEDVAAGWVLNWAALKGSNWERVREDQREFNSEFLDFSQVKNAPFRGAKSCAWIQRNGEGDTTTRVLLNSGTERLVGTDYAAAFATKTEWVPSAKEFESVASDYVIDGRCEFKAGATLVPHSLVQIGESEDGFPPGTRNVTLRRSKHSPWNDLPQMSGNVPASYVRKVVMGPRDLLTFALSPTRSLALIPVNENGDLDRMNEGDDRVNNGFWRHLDEAYKDRSALGISTPRTLWDRLDRNRGLSSQLGNVADSDDRLVKVAHNSSGQILRAARLAAGIPVDHSSYYFVADTEEESGYLVCLLNAPCLQSAFQGARRSDRHFMQHIWRRVPIPRFDPENADHLELARLCAVAEESALTLVTQVLPEDASQVMASKRIRRELRDTGIADEIDAVVRRVMPQHSVAKYDRTNPHPWAV